MAKFRSPLGTNTLYITQTTHGESASNPNDLSKQKAVDLSANGGQYVYSVTDGTVELVTTGGGSYISIIPTGEKFRILYVHVDNFYVKKGDKVKVGTRIAKVRSMTGSHLHFGLKNISGLAPHPNPMDYFDRGLVFKTRYASIEKIWFKGGQLNWALFKDLQWGPVTPPQPPSETECEKRVKELESQNLALDVEIGGLKGALRVLEDENAELQRDYDEQSIQLGNKVAELDEEINRNNLLTDRNENLEKENLELRESLSGDLVTASTGDIFAELWKRIVRSIS